jgi:hypothetical protein
METLVFAWLLEHLRGLCEGTLVARLRIMHTPSTSSNSSQPRHVVDLTSLIRSEYLELPALSLTVPQGARLWCIDRRCCQDAFDVLVSEGFLYRLGDSYCRTSGGSRPRH